MPRRRAISSLTAMALFLIGLQSIFASPALAFSIDSPNGTATVGTPFVGYNVTPSGPFLAYQISNESTLTGVGLTFNIATGTISGTPTSALAATTFTISETSPGTPFQTYTLTVVNGGAPTTPAFTLSSSSETATAGSPIAGYTILSTGDLITGYLISPVISNGLSFNNGTGTLSGTPLTAALNIRYTITAHDVASNLATQTFDLTVNPVAPPTGPVFTLSSSSETATALTPITSYSIVSTGTTITRFSISPTPSNGLNFSTSFGALTGTPVTPVSNVTYTITAHDISLNTSSQTFSLTVNAGSPTTPAFTFTSSSETATVGSPIVGYTILSTGSQIVAYLISPSVSNGLTFNPLNGWLSGNPSVAAARVTYVITAFDFLGHFATQTFALTVNAAAPVASVLPDPVQEDVVHYISPTILQPHAAASIEISGSFPRSITAVVVNGLNVTFANTSLTKITALIPPQEPGKILKIQLYNGEVPLLNELALPVANDLPPLSLTSPAANTRLNGKVGVNFSSVITTTGGVAPVKVSITQNGALPTGLALDSSGVITGTPTAAGSSTLSFIVTDSAGRSQTVSGIKFVIAPGKQWVDQTKSGSRYWYSITSSSDGTHLAAVVDGGDLYTSTDSGATWIDRKEAGSRNWYSIASSSDGTHLAAGAYGGDIFTSTDSGLTWVDQKAAGSRNWSSIASSSDGRHLVAGAVGGDIFTSTDSGVTWVDQKAAGSQRWYSFASSSDGTHLAAVINGGDLFTSTDSGLIWVDQKAAGSRYWNAIASSSDGTHLVAVGIGQDIYTSTDSGLTWVDQKAAGSRNWYSIASSSDGTHLAAGVYNSGIFTSTDSGLNWVVQRAAGSQSGYSIASSSDGTHLAAVAYGGDIWTYTGSTLNSTVTPPVSSTPVTAKPLVITAPLAKTVLKGTVGGKFSASITSTGGVAPISYTVTTGKLPEGIVLVKDGTISGIPTAAANSKFTITASDSATPTASASAVTIEINISSPWTDQKAAGSRNWNSIASSSDGAQMAAVINGGDIWTSTDSGLTWVAQKAAGSREWHSIASSSDGTHLGAAVLGGDIWTSTDSGLTWGDQKAAGSRYWLSIASNSDGTHLSAVEYGGDIWTSTDSGVTWVDQKAAGSRKWFSIASSSDGTHLAAVEYGSDIYTSTDSGLTWVDQKAAGSRNWSSIASSSDGTHLAVVERRGDIYTSTDSGLTWVDQKAAGSGSWYSSASSSDGTHLAAVAYGGDIWTY